MESYLQKLVSLLIFVHLAFSQNADSIVFSKCNGGGSADQSACDKFEFVSRREWQTGSYNRGTILRLPIRYVIVHDISSQQPCTDKDQCLEAMRSLQHHDITHQSKSDIRYNFVIGADGDRVYEGKGWRYQGEHVGDTVNPVSLSIGILGSYGISYLPQELECLTLNLIACGLKQQYLHRNFTIHAHSDVTCTNCPGKKLKEQMGKWPRYGKQHPNYNCY